MDDELIIDTVREKLRKFLPQLRAAKTQEERGALLQKLNDSPVFEYAGIPLSFNFSLNDDPALPAINEFLKKRKEIKLWLINEAYWYAADSKESAIQAFKKDQEFGPDDLVEVEHVTDAEMDELLFEEENGLEIPFREYLTILIMHDTKFPCSFAFNE